MKKFFAYIIIGVLLNASVARSQSWFNINSTVTSYVVAGEYASAIPLALKGVEAAAKEFGKQHGNYAIALSSLGACYLFSGRVDTAEIVFLESLALFEKAGLKNTADYSVTLYTEAKLLFGKTNYEGARSLIEQSLNIRRGLLGNNDPLYGTILQDLSTTLVFLSKNDTAKIVTEQVLALQRKAVGENHPAYALGLLNLGELYNRDADFATCLKLFVQALDIFNRSGQAKQPNYIGIYGTLLNNVGATYKRMGQFDKADSMYVIALPLRKQLFGEHSSEYAETIGNLAELRTSQGRFEEAELLSLQTVEIRKTKPGTHTAAYATALNNLALFYIAIGSYEKAMPLLKESMALRKEILGEKHPDYSESLNNLGFVYGEAQLYDDAEKYFLEAKALHEKWFSKNNTVYSMVLNNLSTVYINQRKFKQAEELLNKSLKIRETLLGKDNADYATSLNNLAFLYSNAGDHTKALSFYIRSLPILKKTLGTNHAMYNMALTNQAFENYFVGKYAVAETLIDEATNNGINSLFAMYTGLSELEKSNFIQTKFFLNDLRDGFIYKYPKASPAFYTNSYNLQLMLKSLSLSATKIAMEAIKNSPDTSLRKSYQLFTNNRRILSDQYSLPLVQRRKDLPELERTTETLEKELYRRSASLSKEQKNTRVTYKQVQAALEPGEVAIEFVRSHLFSESTKDSVIYAAYVVRANDAVPLFVRLFEEKQLRTLIEQANRTPGKVPGNFYRGLVGESNYGSLADKVYKLIWQPLEKHLKGITKIAYSPAGDLYNISFQALKVDSATLLMDKYQLRQYTSTRDVVLRKEQKENASLKDIILFGNPQFMMDSAAFVSKKPVSTIISTSNLSLTAISKEGSKRDGFDSLPGTYREIKMIDSLLRTHHVSSVLLNQADASEENIKALTGHSPQVLHISTHGFFFAAPRKAAQNNFNPTNTFSLAEDPLLRSGLILAGGANTWEGMRPPAGVEDGVATAYEISQLDLSKTELVVLSACKTALGDIEGSEGIFGLQRAFKMAGVKKLLVSLWEVPDNETAELMQLFYSNWVTQNKTISEAFKLAQNTMKQKYPGEPVKWAAFILIE